MFKHVCIIKKAFCDQGIIVTAYFRRSLFASVNKRAWRALQGSRHAGFTVKAATMETRLVFLGVCICFQSILSLLTLLPAAVSKHVIALAQAVRRHTFFRHTGFILGCIHTEIGLISLVQLRDLAKRPDDSPAGPSSAAELHRCQLHLLLSAGNLLLQLINPALARAKTQLAAALRRAEVAEAAVTKQRSNAAVAHAPALPSDSAPVDAQSLRRQAQEAVAGRAAAEERMAALVVQVGPSGRTVVRHVSFAQAAAVITFLRRFCYIRRAQYCCVML